MVKRALIWSLFQIALFALSASIVHADFGLMLGSFRSENNAHAYMQRFHQTHAALNAFLEKIRMPGKGLWYRVSLGPFEDQNKAIQQKEKLKTDGYKSVVIKIKSDIIHSGQTQVQTRQGKQQPPLIAPDPSGLTEKSPPKSEKAAVTKKASSSQKETIENLPDNDDKKSRIKVAPVKTATSAASSKPQTPENVGEKTLPPLIPPTSSGALGDLFTIMPGDIIHIEIPEQKQMTKDYDVDPDGNIYMVTVGKLHVGGMSPGQILRLLEREAKQFITEDTPPSVRIIDRQRYIQIRGGVNYPGWYHVPQTSDLTDLIEMAGGLVVGVNESDIRLKRGDRKISIKGEISLQPNDIILVPVPKEFARKVDSGDMLFINIPEKPALTEFEDIEKRVVQNKIEVDRNGYIYVPNYGHIYVKGLTTADISKLITDRLPKYLARAAKVHVNVIEKKHYVEILGHVEKPEWYNISENANIQSALTKAGGAVDGAIMSDIFVSRKWGGEVHRVKVNLYQFTVTGDLRLLTPVQENDTIFVPISGAFGNVKRTLSDWQPPPAKLEEDTGTKVRIFGAVHRPGIFETMEDMNMLDLLIKAGGNRDDADLGNTLLIREGKSEKYDLNALILESIKGRVEIPKVKNGDSMYVAFVKKAGYEKQEPKEMVRIFGAVRNPGIFEPTEDMNLMDALALAKGVSANADQAKVIIMRKSGGAETFDLKKFMQSKKMDLNKLPKINASDTVYVNYLLAEGLKEPDPREMIRVMGAVQKPGVFEPIKDGNVMDAISLARGIRYDADQANVLIMRNNGKIERFDLRELLESKEKGSRPIPRVFPGETIYVNYLQREDLQDAQPVYVIGKVDSPGAYALAEGGMTVFQVIALAGGLDEWADKDDIMIIRMVNGKQQNIAFNYDKAISGKYPELNIRLRENDTVYVP